MDNFHKIVVILSLIINFHQLNPNRDQMLCLVITLPGQHFSHFGQLLVWSAVSKSTGKSQRFSQTPFWVSYVHSIWICLEITHIKPICFIQEDYGAKISCALVNGDSVIRHNDGRRFAVHSSFKRVTKSTALVMIYTIPFST